MPSLKKELVEIKKRTYYKNGRKESVQEHRFVMFISYIYKKAG